MRDLKKRYHAELITRKRFRYKIVYSKQIYTFLLKFFLDNKYIFRFNFKKCYLISIAYLFESKILKVDFHLKC